MNDQGNAHEIHALSGAYAVDALDADERARFEAHLASCATCQDEVDSLREATALLADTTAVAPPAALRERVLAEIATVRPLPPEKTDTHGSQVTRLHPRRRLWTMLAAAAAVVAIAGGGAVVWHDVSGSGQHGTQLTAVDRVLQAADAKRVSISLPGGVRASVVRSVTEGKAVLVTRNMPPAPSGHIYEVWLQTPGGAMVPAATMSNGGSRTVLLEGDAASATGAGITVEPQGGSESPTTKPIALFDFSRAT